MAGKIETFKNPGFQKSNLSSPLTIMRRRLKTCVGADGNCRGHNEL